MRTSHRTALFLSILLTSMWAVAPRLWSSEPADATQAIVAFDAANKLYEQGKFADAASGYQRLIDAGSRSVGLYFNLGNARFKAGQVGRAIAAYRQAERLAPRDPGVQFNLTFARKKVTSGEPPAVPIVDRMLGALTLNEWTWLAAGGFWLALLLLAAGELRDAFRPTARRYAAVVAVAALAFAAGTAGAAQRWRNPADGVVVAPEAIARSGPLEEAKVLHQFRDGTEVKILDRKKLVDTNRTQVWLQVRNNKDQAGWVKADQVAVVR